MIAPIVFFFGLKPYQQDRVLIFLNPENDPLGAGYHITQSKIAIGSGGIFGKGFGNGTQSHLDYLPEGHTDFVFATMAEEWGIVGGLFILFLYYLLMRWGISVAMQQQDALRTAGRRRAYLHDILLHHDQSVDGGGPGPGRRHSPALCQPWRIVDADNDDLRWHHHVNRAPPRRKARPIQLGHASHA